MDTLKIKSDFMNSLLSKIVTLMIRKRTGYNITLSFNGVTALTTGDTVHFHANLSGEISKEDFMRLLSGKGLDV